MALQIVKKDTAESLFKVVFNQEYGLIRYVAEMDYATFKEKSHDPDYSNFANVVSITEGILNSLQLTNVRQVDINEKAGFNHCAATISDGKKEGGKIEYITQKTKDNQLFVEVSFP